MSDERAARLFVAIALDPEVRAALSATARELVRGAAEARWTRGDAMHVTLKFLGAVETARLAELATGLQQAVVAFPQQRITVRGLGVFPTRRQSRIVWAGIEGPDLQTLAASVEHAFTRLGFAAEQRPFHPHVTLARLRGARAWSALRARLEEGAARRFGCSLVKSVDIFRSDLRRDGAVYTNVCRAPLAAPVDQGGTDGS